LKEANTIKVLVVGYKGEVGSALYELLRGKSNFQVYGIDINETTDLKEVDVMHICYECKDEQEFVETTINYIRKYNPALTIINSTLIPTVTEKITRETGKPVAHSPVRGMHPYMKHDLLHYVKFIGALNQKAGKTAREHFESLGMKTYVCDSSKETEFAKLFVTSYYALMIAWHQEMWRICKKFGVNYDQVIDFIKAEEDKPVLYPGVIGGHCLIPNIHLLLKKYESKLLEAVLESNQKMRNEVGEGKKQPRGTIRRDKWKFTYESASPPSN
jgi:UDP-N-acetyl-D-mannosaminuronate dehydrogenase